MPCRFSLVSAPALVFLAVLTLPPGARAAGEASASSPTARVTGRVHALGSPDPVLGAVVRLEGTQAFATTGEDGRYALEGRAGIWDLVFSAQGFAPVKRSVVLAPGQRRVLDVAMDPSSFQAPAVTVRGRREAPQAVQASVSRRQIKEIPGTFGDALRAAQTLPGVAMPDDYSGQLLVQGAGPSDNLYLIDNLPWPIPFHFGGIVSTVDPNLLDSVNLYEAGYGARWGGSLASVLDARTRAPDSDRVHLDADLSFLGADASVEGPTGWGNSTFSLEGRRSLLEALSRLVPFSPVPYYWDGGGSFNFSPGPHDQVQVLALASRDSLAINTTDTSLSATAGSTTIRDDTGYQVLGVNWVDDRLPGITSTFTPYVERVDSLFSFGSFSDDTTRTTLGLKEEADWRAGTWLGMDHQVSFGGDLESSSYAFYGYFPRVTATSGVTFSDLTNMAATASTVTASTLAGYAYLQDRARVLPGWTLTLGLHYDKGSTVAGDALEPRASLDWDFDPATRWTLAWGLYAQAPGPMQVNPQYGNPGLSYQWARHVVLGLEKSFGLGLSGKADVYYKTLGGLVVRDPANPGLYDNAGIGDARGLDLSLKEEMGERFFGWISYSLSKSERNNPLSQGWTPYAYDQPDILNVVASYSPDPGWTLGAKLRYNSGPLIEPPGTNQYTRRLDDYLRLDVQADHTWRFNTWSLRLYGGVLNLLNRANPSGEYTNALTGQTETTYDLPRLPNLGLEATY